jgi:hypothetical protein
METVRNSPSNRHTLNTGSYGSRCVPCAHTDEPCSINITQPISSHTYSDSKYGSSSTGSRSAGADSSNRSPCPDSDAEPEPGRPEPGNV